MKKKKQLIVEQRCDQQRWAERKLAEGLCRRCGHGKRDLNPHTGKPYLHCPACRQTVAAESKLRQARLRAAGRDSWLNRRLAGGN